jgi:hypothetical protein
MVRLATTPALLGRFLEALAPYGFAPERVQFTPDGSIILHASVADDAVDRDPLTEWELKRGRPLH